MKNIITNITSAALIVCALTLLAGCRKSDSSPAGPADAAAGKKYHCPMHPTYVSGRPGDCPICGMKLVPIGADQSGAAASAPSLPGRMTIHLSAEKRQLIGLTSSLVETQRLSQLIRASATVTHDETTLSRVAPRFGGWVRKLYVNFTGQQVAAGEPLFSVYSPELFGAETDYLITLRASRSQTNNAEARRLLDASHRRLELLQIGDEEIRALGERDRPGDELLIRAPVSGHVIAKAAVAGKAFMPGESLYEIAPLSRLWVRANVNEFDVSRVVTGQTARATFSGLDGAFVEGRVAFISPHMDPQTRRVEVRMAIDNPNHSIKPDMWANVEIEVNLGDVLAVPASAVIDTGQRNVAFVDRDDGHLEPREVKVGAKTDDYWQVLDGLQPGEKVVTRALFLVDSESQLKAAISGAAAAGEHKH